MLEKKKFCRRKLLEVAQDRALRQDLTLAMVNVRLLLPEIICYLSGFLIKLKNKQTVWSAYVWLDTPACETTNRNSHVIMKTALRCEETASARHHPQSLHAENNTTPCAGINNTCSLVMNSDADKISTCLTDQCRFRNLNPL